MSAPTTDTILVQGRTREHLSLVRFLCVLEAAQVHHQLLPLLPWD